VGTNVSKRSPEMRGIRARNPEGIA